jgi:hypothetical protein
MKLFERNPYKRLGWELTFDPVLVVLWAIFWSSSILLGTFFVGCALYLLGWST